MLSEMTELRPALQRREVVQHNFANSLQHLFTILLSLS